MASLPSRLLRVAQKYKLVRNTSSFITATRTLDTTNPLPGTVPPHKCYVFLHTPNPPATYPAKYSTPVQRALLGELVHTGGSVNFCWSENGPSHPLRPEGEEAMQEYYLTAFSSARGKIEVPVVSMANVPEVGNMLREHTQPLSSGEAVAVSEDIHVYVCTHMARDCRCGNTGSAVIQAFREELGRRRDASTRVKLAESAHVGGHKYAANVLVYPHGEWLGLVKHQDVPDILDTILATPARPVHPNEKPMCPSYWRGRMGLSKEAQLELFTRHYH
ncbi:Sucrase/ferredoxin-like-domain-containing protein [Scleroderma yunnanense]